MSSFVRSTGTCSSPLATTAFGRICHGLGHPALAEDPRFATNPARVANRGELRQAIEAITADRATADVTASLRAAGAPCSELNDVAQMLANDQVAAMDIVKSLPVDGAPHHRVVALPVRGNGGRASEMRAPSALGADTADVLTDLGYRADEIAALKAASTIG